MALAFMLKHVEGSFRVLQIEAVRVDLGRNQRNKNIYGLPLVKTLCVRTFKTLLAFSLFYLLLFSLFVSSFLLLAMKSKTVVYFFQKIDEKRIIYKITLSLLSV